MEFIKAEEFLKQPVEVQKVLLEWWKPSEGDLFIFNKNKLEFKECVLCSNDIFINGINDTYDSKECIPLFSEGQLRQFIEDKTNRKVDLTYYKDTGYDICLDNFNGLSKNRHELYLDLGTDLLQAYWKVATQISKEE